VGIRDPPEGRVAAEQLGRPILVPFAAESALSGVMKDVGTDNRLWYRRTFTVPEDWKDQRVLLHFGAVDWETTVWVNGKEVGTHRGGYDPFSFDLADAAKAGGENEIVVAVWDPTDAGEQPRGKQLSKPHGIWYTPVTGIWQTVWIEPVPKTRVESLRITPKIEGQDASIRIEAHWGGTGRTRLRALGDPGGSRCRGQTRCVNVDRFIRR
jgi:beta-galactosidase/beta-glucuronidase